MTNMGLRYRAGQRQQLVQLLRLAALYFCQTNQRPLGALKSTGNEEYCCAEPTRPVLGLLCTKHNGAPVADGLREVCDRDYYIGCCGYTDGNTVGWSTLVPPVPNVWKATESNYTSGGLMYWW
ncbi:hypothetical protein PC118_g14151 [Phytophthora cactorum]|uniref:Uncharacterized protein n=1 Tax=Phytophthora cactorum TaxID=29920 RepID=A0A8T1FMP0_9STRA|nr:hypothetical protein PC118_g14151 [Phytophthora cactorum]